MPDFASQPGMMIDKPRATENNVVLNDERIDLQDTEKSLLNILDDYREEKSRMENTQSALLNILEDVDAEKLVTEQTQRALLNILEDYAEEKTNLENIQSAVLNILEDYGNEKRKVEIINNDLITANKELEQFAYVASHDLQEPLRTITNFVDLLQRKYSGKLDKDTALYVGLIVNAAARMQNLIKDLLEFSRIGRNESFKEVDCNHVLKIVLTNLTTSVELSHAKIDSVRLPGLIANETELIRLFQNLVSNAIKFRKESVAPEIEISFEDMGAEYQFAIKDNGIGIEKKYEERIFIIFQRLHSAEDYPGTGIGLASCKKIVAMHGGRIWIESKVGEGTVFYFTLKKEIPS